MVIQDLKEEKEDLTIEELKTTIAELKECNSGLSEKNSRLEDINRDLMHDRDLFERIKDETEKRYFDLVVRAKVVIRELVEISNL